MLQSLMSRWNLTLALRSSSLFSRDWTFARRMLGRGGRKAWALSLFRILPCFLRYFLQVFLVAELPLLLQLLMISASAGCPRETAGRQVIGAAGVDLAASQWRQQQWLSSSIEGPEWPAVFKSNSEAQGGASCSSSGGPVRPAAEVPVGTAREVEGAPESTGRKLEQ